MQIRKFSKESSMLGDRFAVDGVDLVVWFKGGKAYRVAGAAIQADDFANAESAGQFYNSQFKGATLYEVTRDQERDL